MVKRSSCLLFFVFFIALVFLLQPVAGQTASQPQLPQTFWGKVLIGDDPAGTGLEVEAVGPGVYSREVEMEGKTIPVEGNPVVTMAGGVYGEPGLSQKLLVQGDIEPGTPLEFYVGGIRAEVFPVATNGPWKTNYSYIPGEDTELDLRIAAQPSTSQTREPTPVQTRLPASAVQGFLPEPSVITTVQPGMEGTENLPAVQPTMVTIQPGDTVEPGSQGTVVGPQETQTVYTGEEPLPGGINTTLLFGGILIIVVVILGGVYYAISRKKAGGQDEKGKDEEKQEDQKER
jgi:hypothetical protein